MSNDILLMVDIGFEFHLLRHIIKPMTDVAHK